MGVAALKKLLRTRLNLAILSIVNIRMIIISLSNHALFMSVVVWYYPKYTSQAVSQGRLT